MGYAGSPFRDSKSSVRIEVGLAEKFLQLFLKQYKSNFGTYEMSPCIFSIKVISEVVYSMGDHEGTLQIEVQDISLKKNPFLTCSGGTFGTLRFNDKSFFKSLLCFASYWDYIPTNAFQVNSPGVYTSYKNLN